MATYAVVLAPMSPFGKVIAFCVECKHFREAHGFLLGRLFWVTAPICPSIVADFSLTDRLVEDHFLSPMLTVSLLTVSFLRLQERVGVSFTLGSYVSISTTPEAVPGCWFVTVVIFPINFAGLCFMWLRTVSWRLSSGSFDRYFLWMGSVVLWFDPWELGLQFSYLFI